MVVIDTSYYELHHELYTYKLDIPVKELKRRIQEVNDILKRGGCLFHWEFISTVFEPKDRPEYLEYHDIFMYTGSYFQLKEVELIGGSGEFQYYILTPNLIEGLF